MTRIDNVWTVWVGGTEVNDYYEDKFKDYILREWQDHQNDLLNQKGE